MGKGNYIFIEGKIIVDLGYCLSIVKNIGIYLVNKIVKNSFYRYCYYWRRKRCIVIYLWRIMWMKYICRIWEYNLNYIMNIYILLVNEYKCEIEINVFFFEFVVF